MNLDSNYYFGIKTVIDNKCTFDNYWRNINAHYLFKKYYTIFNEGVRNRNKSLERYFKN